MAAKKFSRRDLLKMSTMGAAALLGACAPATPMVIEKEVIKEVEVEKPVVIREEVVKEVVKEVPVEIEVEKVVEKEVLVEKVVEKIVQAPTPIPKGAIAGLKAVPRNRTLIMAGLGGEHPGAFMDVEQFNLYLSGVSRSGLYQSANEGFIYANMLNATEQTPWIAESYKYNDDFTVLEIKIRKGVEWSDGEPYTARDPAFMLNMLKANATMTSSGDLNIFCKTIEAPDDYTLRITFNKPSPRFMFDYLTFWADFGISNICAEHVWKDVEDPATFTNYDPAKGWPLVTGPYRLVASTVEQKIWDVRPDWWAAKIGLFDLPRVERQIHLPGMNEITMAQMCIANEIDMAFSMTPTNMQLIQSQNPKFITHCPRPPYGFTDWWPQGLGWNCMVKPFDDPEIRWAMSYVVNRDEIIKFAFAGFNSIGFAIPFPEYKALEPWMEQIEDLLEERNPLEYNPSKSEEIMTGKGYTKDNEGFWVGADGKRIQPEIVTFPQHPSATPCAPVVTEQLRRGGFDATFLLPADFGARLTTGQANAFVWGHGGSVFDPYKTMDLYHSRFAKPIGESAYPFYRWVNEEFDALLDQMAVLPFGDERIKPLWHELAEIYLRELPDTMLCQTVIQLPMNTTYWEGWPSCDNEYIHEGFWHKSAMLMWIELDPTQA
jgi:peptide/nickel transport system substrate-binding protein